jgi:Terminase large subunit, T4likevirus-type, N-terminal
MVRDALTELRWQLDPVAFFEDAVGPAQDWQKGVLRSTANKRLLLASRQSGKSQTCAILALHTALYTPNTLVLCIAPALRQAQELTHKVFTAYRDLGLSGMRPARTENKLSLELENGSRIITLPGTEKTIRGYSKAGLLLIDEAARVDDQLYYAVSPMLAVSGGSIIMMSTPYGKQGVFYEAWASGGDEWERHQMKASDLPPYHFKPSTAEFLAKERRTNPDYIYRQEYECSFEATEDQIFTEEMVRGALDETVEPLLELEEMTW